MVDIKMVSQKPVPEVVDALKAALAEAENGTLRNVAVVGQASSGDAFLIDWGLEDNISLIGLLTRVVWRINFAMEMTED